MLLRLNSRQSKYLRAAKEISQQNSKIFNKNLVGEYINLGEGRNNKDGEIIQFLVSNKFIIELSTETYKITSRAEEYLNWEKKQNLLNKTKKIFEIFFNKHANANRLLYGFLTIIAFIVIDHFVYEIYSNKDFYNVLKTFYPESGKIETVIFNIVFLVIFSLAIYKNKNSTISFWDSVVLLIYTYFRADLSNWFFWPIYSIEDFSFLYIDVIPVNYLVRFVFAIKRNLYKIQKKPTGSESYLTLDLPLKELSENEAKSITDLDGLGRNKFAQQIAEEIALMRPYRAFAIGINGPWGSGKTSLIDLIIQDIKKFNYKDDIVFMDFFPWFSRDTESLVINFFSKLEKTLNSNEYLRKNIEAYVKAIEVIEKKVLETEFSSLLSQPVSDIKKRYKNIVNEIKNENKLIVIKIDDLDRLTTEEIIDTLRLIRIIANFPNTVYIAGYDKGYIDAAIREGLTNYNSDKYLDKVFNVEFRIPELSGEIIYDHLKRHIIAHITNLTKGNKITLAQQKQVIDYFHSLKHIQLYPFIQNERDIIRFTNIFLMRYLSVREDVNFEDFFNLELIHYKYPDIYLEIYQNKGMLTS